MRPDCGRTKSGEFDIFIAIGLRFRRAGSEAGKPVRGLLRVGSRDWPWLPEEGNTCAGVGIKLGGINGAGYGVKVGSGCAESGAANGESGAPAWGWKGVGDSRIEAAAAGSGSEKGAHAKVRLDIKVKKTIVCQRGLRWENVMEKIVPKGSKMAHNVCLSVLLFILHPSAFFLSPRPPATDFLTIGLADTIAQPC